MHAFKTLSLRCTWTFRVVHEHSRLYMNIRGCTWVLKVVHDNSGSSLNTTQHVSHLALQISILLELSKPSLHPLVHHWLKCLYSVWCTVKLGVSDLVPEAKNNIGTFPLLRSLRSWAHSACHIRTAWIFNFVFLLTFMIECICCGRGLVLKKFVQSAKGCGSSVCGLTSKDSKHWQVQVFFKAQFRHTPFSTKRKVGDPNPTERKKSAIRAP